MRFMTAIKATTLSSLLLSTNLLAEGLEAQKTAPIQTLLPDSYGSVSMKHFSEVTPTKEDNN